MLQYWLVRSLVASNAFGTMMSIILSALYDISTGLSTRVWSPNELPLQTDVQKDPP